MNQTGGNVASKLNQATPRRVSDVFGAADDVHLGKDGFHVRWLLRLKELASSQTQDGHDRLHDGDLSSKVAPCDYLLCSRPWSKP